MTPYQLRLSVLQKAVQGKITEQKSDDGNAKDLLDEIVKIKSEKEKKLTVLSPITNEEVPYDIPESWIWVKLKDIVNIYTGKRDANFGNETGKYCFFTCARDPIRCDSFSFSGESILIAGNGDIGNISFYDGDFEAYQRTYVLQPFIEHAYLKYILYHIRSNWVKYNTDKMFGTAIPYIRLGNIQNYLVALPPLKEQQRIVAKIEELIPLIDRYEEAWNKLKTFNDKFPKEMEKSILQFAIQGKLVEQRISEGNSHDLLTAIKKEIEMLRTDKLFSKQKEPVEIDDGDAPFEIPKQWEWVSLGECGLFVRGSGIPKSVVKERGFPCVRYGQMYTTYKTRFSKTISFVDQDVFQKAIKASKGDLLMSLTGENNFDIALAACYEGKNEIAIGGDMCKFSPIFVNSMYLVYVLNSPYGIDCKRRRATGNIIVHTSTSKLSSIKIPLPPLEEQKRIVAKLEELLPLCRKLIK